jgi:hypothetical protein
MMHCPPPDAALARFPEVVPLALVALMRCPDARALAASLGPALWPDPVSGSIAAAILAGVPWRPHLAPRWLTPARALVSALAEWVGGEWSRGIATDPERARGMVRLLAELRYAPLAAPALRWAAREVEAGADPGAVLPLVADLLALADGQLPGEVAA